jgi:hypothetical protein
MFFAVGLGLTNFGLYNPARQILNGASSRLGVRGSVATHQPERQRLVSSQA